MDRSRPHPIADSQRGFTLGEVVTTLGVIGVSLSLAVPSLDSIARSNVRAGAINELVATLHVARSEAITRNAPIVVCPSNNGQSCAEVAWETGWIRFVDSNGNYRVDAGEPLLGATPTLAGVRIRTEAFDKAFSYAPTGRVAGADGAEGGGDFTFCGIGNGADAQVVIVTALGQPALASHHADGRDLDCPET